MNDDSSTPAGSKPAAADSPGAESPPPPRRKGCGCWTVSLTTIAAAVAFVLGVYALWRWSNARALERMIAIAKEKGEPTTWEELSATQPTSPEIERTTQLWLEAIDAANPPYVQSDLIDVAILGSADPQDAAGRAALQRHFQTGEMTPRILAASKAYLAKVGDAVELAHAARRSGALARVPSRREMSQEEFSESIQRRRRLGQVLALDLEVSRAEGRTEGLGENLLSLVALLECTKESHDPLVQTGRPAFLQIGREQLLRSLERDELSNEELTSLQEAWAEVEFLSAFKKTALYDQVAAFRDPIPVEMSEREERLFRPCPEEDACLAAKSLRSILDAADDYESLAAAVAQGTAEKERTFEGPFAENRFQGSGILLLSSALILEHIRTHQSFVDAVVATLACERFRRDRGDWPERLDELVPDYLDAVPPDRWDGGALKYAKSDGELRIYSVGQDRADNGGEIHDNYLATPADYGARLSRPRNPNESAADE